MNLTLNLGTNREEFIEKLATYRYYALNEDLIKGEVENFFKFIRDMSADDISKKDKEYNIQEEEIEAKLKEIEAREQAGGGKNHVKNQENIKKENLKNPENIAEKLKVIIEDNLANISIVCFHKLLFNYENKYLVNSLNLEVKQKFAFIILN